MSLTLDVEPQEMGSGNLMEMPIILLSERELRSLDSTLARLLEHTLVAA